MTEQSDDIRNFKAEDDSMRKILLQNYDLSRNIDDIEIDERKSRIFKCFRKFNLFSLVKYQTGGTFHNNQNYYTTDFATCASMFAIMFMALFLISKFIAIGDYKNIKVFYQDFQTFQNAKTDNFLIRILSSSNLKNTIVKPDITIKANGY